MNKRVLFGLLKTFLLGILALPMCYAQDIHFSQMNFSPMTVNPANAGLGGKYNALVNYRSQWNSVSSPFSTVAASFDMQLTESHQKRGYLAGGLNFFYDWVGTSKMTTTNVNLNLAYHILLAENNTLGLGMQMGYGQRGLGRIEGMFASQYDGVDFDENIPSGENFGRQNFDFFDLGGGLVYQHNSITNKRFNNEGYRLRIGVAAYHLTKPDYSYLQAGNDDLKMRFSGFVESEFFLRTSSFSLQPALYYNRQGKSQEILLGTYIKYHIVKASVQTGLLDNFAIAYAPFYRFGDAFVNMLLVEYKSFSLGVAYDLNISSLTQASKGRGGFEFALRYSLDERFMSRSRIQ